MCPVGCFLFLPASTEKLLQEPFFHGAHNHDQLVKIVKVLGTEEFQAYLLK
jgi:hypothetical protein